LCDALLEFKTTVIDESVSMHAYRAAIALSFRRSAVRPARFDVVAIRAELRPPSLELRFGA